MCALYVSLCPSQNAEVSFLDNRHLFESKQNLYEHSKDEMIRQQRLKELADLDSQVMSDDP